jgi:acetoacetate decarboxylase
MKINDVRRSAFAMPLSNATADLQLFRHVAADVARLPVLEVISGWRWIELRTA